MLTGHLFRLNSGTLGIHSVNEQRIAVMIPEGVIVKVVSSPRAEDRMIDVLWEGRKLSVFTEDFLKRGTEVQSVRQDRSTSA